MSIIPTTTGAAKAVALVIPELKGKFDGYAMRVPTSTVSVVDFVAGRQEPRHHRRTVAAFDAAAAGPMKGILPSAANHWSASTSRATRLSSTVDAEFTKVYGNMVKVVTWYDNEWAYSVRVTDLADYMVEEGHLVKEK
jgi:glyceraldehyde 3-phosphate dehydrogenase